MRIEFHHYHHPGNVVPPWAVDLNEKLDRILDNLEIIMFDQTKILAVVARLEADDTAAVAALTALRDQNKQVSAQLADVSQQLADLKAGGDTAAVQTAIDAIADRLGATADAVEAGVASNPAVTDMPPAPAA